MSTALDVARFQDTALEPVREKVLAGQRLSAEDGLALYRTPDLLGLGWLANHDRERRHGDAAYFVWNTHVNHTNVCVATCDCSNCGTCDMSQIPSYGVAYCGNAAGSPATLTCNKPCPAGQGCIPFSTPICWAGQGCISL